LGVGLLVLPLIVPRDSDWTGDLPTVVSVEPPPVGPPKPGVLVLVFAELDSLCVTSGYPDTIQVEVPYAAAKDRHVLEDSVKEWVLLPEMRLAWWSPLRHNLLKEAGLDVTEDELIDRLAAIVIARGVFGG
jgi:hypothetical protein